MHKHDAETSSFSLLRLASHSNKILRLELLLLIILMQVGCKTSQTTGTVPKNATPPITPTTPAPAPAPPQVDHTKEIAEFKTTIVKLTPQEQVEAVKTQLVAVNSFLRTSDIRIKIALSGNVRVSISGKVNELWPLGAVDNLTDLYVYPGFDCDLSDLRPLAGKPIKSLFLEHTKVKDLSPLRGMPLESVIICGSLIEDVSPLVDCPIKVLCIPDSGVKDLEPLRGMKLRELDCSKTLITDLSPIRGMPLEFLKINETKISDLSPLVGMKLTYLSCTQTRVRDLGPIYPMPLGNLDCDGEPNADYLAQRIPTLERVNNHQIPGRGIETWGK